MLLATIFVRLVNMVVFELLMITLIVRISISWLLLLHIRNRKLMG